MQVQRVESLHVEDSSRQRKSGNPFIMRATRETAAWPRWSRRIEPTRTRPLVELRASGGC